MSFRLVDLMFDVPRLTTAEFAVMAAIARRANNETHRGYPSLTTVAREAHLSLRQVQRTLPGLISAGFLTRTTTGQGGGARHEFQIHREVLKAAMVISDTTSPSTDQEEEEKDSDTTSSTDTNNSDTMSHIDGEAIATLRHPDSDKSVEVLATNGYGNSDISASYIGRIGKCNRCETERTQRGEEVCSFPHG
jgi:predicted transcriptional regulator